jgi:hypothetical protein
MGENSSFVAEALRWRQLGHIIRSKRLYPGERFNLIVNLGNEAFVETA